MRWNKEKYGRKAINLDIVHSIGINNGEGKYYSKEGGGCFNLNHNTDIFKYKEVNWDELRDIIERGLGY